MSDTERSQTDSICGGRAGSPEVRAQFMLGAKLAQDGDIAGSKAAYEAVIDSGHHRWASAAAVSLVALLWEHGDLDGARAAYRRALGLEPPPPPADDRR